VQSISDVARDLTPIVVRGSTPGSVAGSGTQAGYEAAAVLATERSHGHTGPPTSRAALRLQRHREAELEFRREERRLLQSQLGGARRLAAQGLAAATAAAVPATVALGDSVTVRYPTPGNPCNASTPVRTVVRFKGSRSIWLEDVGNPAGGFTAAD
jgi:hypothetical protein